MKSELINVTRAKKISPTESPAGIEPMTSRAPGGRSIHSATRTRGEHSHLTELMCDRRLAYC